MDGAEYDMNDDRRADPQGQEISELVQKLTEVERRLQSLTGGQLDAVVDPETGTPLILRNAQTELRRSRARLRLVLDHLPAVVWTTDADLCITSLAGAALSRADVERDDILGRRLSDLEDLIDLSDLLPAHRQALQGKMTSFALTVRGRTFDCSLEPLRRDGGEIAGSIGLAVDVTNRVEMERELREAQAELEQRVEERTADLSEAYAELQVTGEEIRQQNEELRAARDALEAERQRYHHLFEFAPDGYVVTDENGIIREANQVASELLGVRKDFLVGKPLSLFFTSQARGALYALMGRVEQERRLRRLEAELQISPRGGHPFPASVSVAAIQDDADRAGLRWMLRDISESRRLMNENRRQRMFLERLMDVAPVGIALVRGDEHRFEMANAYYRAIPGASRPIIGRTITDVFGDAPAERMEELLDEVYHTAQAVDLRERKGAFVPGEGQTYWNVDLVPLQNLDGSVSSVLILARDVGREVRARSEIERLALRTQRQADQLNAVFDAMTDVVVVFDADGTPIQANRAAVEAYGLDPLGASREEMIETLDVRGPDRQTVSGDSVPSSRALRGEPVENARYLIRGPDGRDRMVVASGAPLRSNGEVTGAVLVWHDVTERETLLAEVNAQRERAQALAADLQRERDKLQTIMENTHAQLAYLDADFTFVHANTAYAHAAGYTKDELIGQGHFELFPHSENEAIFQRVVETGRPVFFRGKPFVYPDEPDRGVTYWDWSLVPVKNDAGDVRGLVFSLLNVTEREQLMRQLEREQARLSAIIQNSPEGIVVADANARVTLTNPAADRLYGRPVPFGEEYESHAELCLCRPDGTAIPPRDLPLTRSALDGETHRDEELAIIWPGGERRDLLVDSAPIRDTRGQITGAVALFRDITERKRMERAVWQYAERLRTLHELDQAILMADSEEEIATAGLTRLRRLIHCRRASVEMFDFVAGESLVLAADADVELYPPAGLRVPLGQHEALGNLRQGDQHVVEDLEKTPSSPLRDALLEEGIRSFISAPLRARGELIGALNVGFRNRGDPTAEDRAIIEDMADELAIGIRQARLHNEVQGYARELEARVAARTAQLRSSEARFRAIFEQSATGIALLDKRGRVLTSNAAMERMLGQTREQLEGLRLTDFAHPDADITADLKAYGQVRDGERESHRFQTRYVSDGGGIGWANLVLSLVRDSRGAPQFIIALVEDITERKRAQEALIQSEKLATTGRLAASLAHEINNPLQTVVGCLGLAEEAMRTGDEEVEEYVTMAHEELKRAARIVSRLRDLSRPSHPGRGEPTDINALVDGVLRVSRKDLKSNYIRVVRHLEEDLPRPLLVPDRIKQVILNLVLNARDAMPEGGELHVTTEHDETNDRVVIAVADQGAGIPPEVQDRVFDPFFSTKSEGSGLGLFVSQNIVQEHGGRIDVESDVGQGATFRVSLPLTQPPTN
jgi:PAS domain S-box-containing protein